MSTRLLAVLCVAVCAAAGCRMADGPMPTPGSEDLNRLDDLRRDLGNIVAGHAEAKQDFLDDLMVFHKPGTKPDAPPAITELARLIGDAAIASQVKEASVPPLLKQVWVAVTARDLSEKQVSSTTTSLFGATRRMCTKCLASDMFQATSTSSAASADIGR